MKKKAKVEPLDKEAADRAAHDAWQAMIRPLRYCPFEPAGAVLTGEMLPIGQDGVTCAKGRLPDGIEGWRVSWTAHDGEPRGYWWLPPAAALAVREANGEPEYSLKHLREEVATATGVAGRERGKSGGGQRLAKGKGGVQVTQTEQALWLALRGVQEAVEWIELEEREGRACYTALRDALRAIGEVARAALAEASDCA